MKLQNLDVTLPFVSLGNYVCTMIGRFSGMLVIIQDLKNIKNVKGCRDGMPKSMQTR